MRVVISDAVCLIDLRKVTLLGALLHLPYTFVIPDTLFEEELMSLTEVEKRTLVEGGFEVRSLPGPLVLRAARYANQHRALSLNDCFALALAEETEDSILLTGDGSLRRVAERRGVDVRGVLWITDELEAHEVVSPRHLYEALALFLDDDLVFLPQVEVRERMTRLARLINA